MKSLQLIIIYLLFLFPQFLFAQMLSLSSPRLHEGKLSYRGIGILELVLIPEYMHKHLGLVHARECFIPSEIENAHSLKSIALSADNIADWGETFSQLSKAPALKAIDLSNNLFEQLPLTIRQLKRVNTIGLSHNPQLDIQQAFEQLQFMDSLKRLSLKSNQMEAIPQNLVQLQALEHLDLSYNPELDYDHLFKILAKLPNLRSLSLEANQIDQLPQSITELKQLRSLYLNENPQLDLKHLFQQLEQLPNLEELHIQGVNAQNLPKEIGNLSTLKVLDLNNNQLQALPSSFRQLQALEQLTAYYNDFTAFPKALEGLKHLKFLGITSHQGFSKTELIESLKQLNKLEYFSFPEQLHASEVVELAQHLPELQRLRLEIWGKHAIPSSIQKLKNLQEIDIKISSEEDPEMLLAGLKNHPSIQALWLTMNSSVPIPAVITDLPQLENLRIDGTNGKDLTKQLPANIGRLKNLKVLEIEHDFKLQNLPNSIGQLKNLEILDLYGTELQSLPQSIGKLRSLRVLRLGGSKFQSLPKSIGQLKNLEYLDLSFNTSTEEESLSIPAQIGGCRSLKILLIEHSNLQKLPQLGKLQKLEILSLKNNDLEQLPEDLGKLSALQILELSGNPLKTAPSSLGALLQLRYLGLSSFALNNIPPVIFELNNLRGLDLKLKAPNLAQSFKLNSGFQQLKALRVLHIMIDGKADWQSLSRELAEIPKLEILQVTTPYIIPKGLGNIRSLRQLAIIDPWGGGSTQSPEPFSTGLEDIAQLSNLQSLYWKQKQLPLLPKGITQLKQLYHLELIDCEKLNFQDAISSMAGMEKLQSLTIKYSYIEKLPAAIGQLKKLKSLRIQSSKLLELPSEISQMSELITLDLEDNLIQQLPPQLQEFKKLRRLDLSKNRIKGLPMGLMYLESLEYLDIRNNFIPYQMVDHLIEHKTGRVLDVWQ